MNRFADINVEWCVAGIEQTLREKANNHEIYTLRGDVNSLEHTCVALRSELDGLRSELQTTQNELRDLVQTVLDLQESAGKAMP